MILKVRLNSDDTKIYRLVSWNTQDFISKYTLTVQSSNLSKVSNDFSDISKIEIFQDEILIATYTDLDGYNEITFVKNVYVSHEQRFTDGLRIRLTKIDLVEQVQRLDNIINPVVDIDTMSLSEVKEYQVKQIGKICREEISAGEVIALPDGSHKQFSYNSDDEINLINAAFMGFVGKVFGYDLNYIPYHSDHDPCSTFTTEEIMTIYVTLQLRLTRLTTKCNLLNCMIREADNKEDVLAITWDTQLTEEYQQRYNEIVTASIGIAAAIIQMLQPGRDDTHSNDETEE